jgi:hypothetical protein
MFDWSPNNDLGPVLIIGKGLSKPELVSPVETLSKLDFQKKLQSNLYFLHR